MSKPMKTTQFIKTCRSLYGETGWQDRLAKAIHVDSSSVRRWTSGAVPVPGAVAAFLKAAVEVKRLEARVLEASAPGQQATSGGA